MATVTSEYNLQVLYPSVAKQWHPTKNGALTPRDVAPKSGRKVWWICSKGHEWKATVAGRSGKYGCPYCARKAVCSDNCLQTINPTLSKEWHPSKNDALTPRDVTPGSGKKVWWICSKGHEWKARISSRNRRNGCPYCAGYKVCKDNCLHTVNRNLSRQWHPTKNKPLSPKHVVANSAKKVWWICGKGHEWQATITGRSKGNGCPYCSGRKVCQDNCLQTINPKLSKEWHPSKNGNLTPKNVTSKSGWNVWWICNKGHEWQNTVKNRNRGTGCPYCAGRMNVEFNASKSNERTGPVGTSINK